MKKWVKVGGFSYYSRALGKCDNFLFMLKKNRKLGLDAKECLDYYVSTFNKQTDYKLKLQEIAYWLEENKLVFEFGKLTVENKIYKNERSIYVYLLRWFENKTNLVDTGTIGRWKEVIKLFEEFKQKKEVQCTV